MPTTSTLESATLKLAKASGWLRAADLEAAKMTQLPWQVWIGMPRGSHTPRIDHPPLRMVQFTGEAYTHGVEEHRVDGVTLRVTSAAKTVADCFKHRHTVGLDVAIEALRDALSQSKASFDHLWRAAKVCRVDNVMRPYLDALA